jgi:hypothetical protein
MTVKRRGSALVFVLIIIAGIVTVTIGTQRLSLVQFNQATREEDNTFAFYAARAGIEDGLLRFRHERDVETATDTIHRVDLTSGIDAGEVNKDTLISQTASYSPINQYYDLTINFKTDQIGEFNFSGTPPVMKQDEEIELTGFSNEIPNYFLRYAFRWQDEAGCRAKGAFVQIQQVNTPATTGDSFLGQIIVRMPASGNTYQSRSTSSNLLITRTTGLSSVVRMRSYHCPVQFAATTTLSNNGVDGGPAFDSLTTKILATGYYGQAKRTLEATVDRKSGRLISIYDFNLYSGETCISSDPAFLNSSRCE